MNEAKTRTTRKLSGSLQKNLQAYTLAAGAAGLGLAVLAVPAEAEVVFTPVEVRIPPDGSYAIDLNGDGVIDFTIQSIRCRQCYPPFSTYTNKLLLRPTTGAAFAGNGVIGEPGRFGAGRKIGEERLFFSDTGQMAYFIGRGGNYRYGSWAYDLGEQYLGLRFTIDGQTHYGWARMRVRHDYHQPVIFATLSGVAYETVPGKAIVTGRISGPAQPDGQSGIQKEELNRPALENQTLGALAVGAPALPLWRRKEGQH